MIDNKQFAYLAGWISSDGSIQCDPKAGRHISFCLKSIDRYVLDLFAQWTNEKVKIHSYPKETKSGLINYECAYLNIWDKKVFEWAASNNLKSKLYGSSQIEQKITIQGILEGDGHVGFSKNNQFRLTFTNQSIHLLNDIMNHFNKYLQIEPKENLKHRADNCYQITYETRTARIIAWYLYYDAEWFLPRKAAIVSKLVDNETNPLKSFISVIFDPRYPQKVIKHNRGYVVRLYNTKDTRAAAKMVCAGFSLLGIDATPIPYGKGKDKYFGIYFPSKHKDLLVYMQGMSFVEKFPGKIRVLNDIKA